MSEVRTGDIFVHYSHGHVRAISRAISDASAARQPSNPNDLTGFQVSIEYHVLQATISVREIKDGIHALGIAQGPLTQTGDVKQGVLWRFSLEGLRVLREVSAEPWPTWAEAALDDGSRGDSTRKSWIFQANPAQWDLEAALKELTRLTWRVKQHRHEIHAGDTAYMWVSGEHAGVVAVTTVLSEPAMIADDEAERRFARSDGELDTDAQLQVPLRVDRVLPNRIDRRQLIDHPILKHLRIIAQPQGTNFPVTPEQEAALNELVTNVTPAAPNGRRAPRVVKIAPGEGARLWPECLVGGYICVGWEEVGDLRAFPTQDDFLTAFRIHFPASGTVSANSLWDLLALEPGDLIVANRGKEEILGVGEVVAPGYVWRPERREYNHTVAVRWDTSVAKRIPTQHSWVRTIVPVPGELWAQIGGVVNQPPPPPPPPPEVDFDALLRALDEEGLAFSAETVANYLLALQTKRFVIFTGISGTGKTQLALAIARAFQSHVRVMRAARVPEGTTPIRIYPNHVATSNRKIVLPAEFTATVDLPATGAGPRDRQIDVHYPRGTTKLTIYKEPERNVTNLFMRGDFMDWFKANLRPGDTVLLEAVDQRDGLVALRFSLPEVETREEPLDNLVVAAVRPDWTDSRGLLGYRNPLTGEYQATPFLRLLLRASDEAEAAGREGRTARPFFAVLDEMNLARVEHYFSDFLSALESGEPLDLHDDEHIEAGEGDEALPIPRRLPVPPNLFFTGTVNVDETTYMFSPKVLDRAFTLEFNRVDLRSFGADPGAPPSGTGPVVASATPLTLDRFPGALRHEGRPTMTAWDAFGQLEGGDLREIVVALHELLAEEGRGFGYRVAVEIARFVVLAAEQAAEGPAGPRAALDLAILQKILPKFHGTQQELEGVLTTLFDFALHGRRRDDPVPPEQSAGAWRLGRDGRLVPVVAGDGAAPSPALPGTAAKLWSMLRRLRAQGFTSFVE